MLALIPFLLAACALGPGLLLVRHSAWRPLERLCAAVGASILLAFLECFAIYLSEPSSAAYWLVPAVGLVCAWVARSELRRLFRDAQVRAAVMGYGLLALWCLTLLALVRNYGGGGWSSDWLEHYQRSLFFLEHRSIAAPIQPGNYLLTARPPLFNLIGTMVLACTGKSFPTFQITATLLNTLLYLPVTAFALRFAGAAAPSESSVTESRQDRPCRTQALPALVLVAMMANPFIVTGATYSWTKLLTAYFVLVGLYFYVRWMETGALVDVLAAFGALTVGLLTHYSAGPYVAVLGAHFLFRRLWQQRRPLRTLLALTALCVPLLACWFGWAIWQFGLVETFTSNTSVTAAKVLSPGQNLLKILSNALATVVPHPLRDVRWIFLQPSALGTVRDYFFLIYQTNVLFMLGSTAWVCCLQLALRSWRTPAGGRPSRRLFWLSYTLSALVLGIVVVGEPEEFGLGHICPPALVPLGFAFLAFGYTKLGGWQRLLLMTGLVLDLEFIALQFYLQHLSWSLTSPGYGLSHFVRGQFSTKAYYGLEFLGDVMAELDVVLVAALCLLLLAAVRWAAIELRAGATITTSEASAHPSVA